jgi:peptide chain release factor 2
MEILASKIKQAQDDKRERRPKLQASFGHQTRTYVLQPYTLVKDHRTGFETGNASSILDGNLTDFMEAYLRQPA